MVQSGLDMDTVSQYLKFLDQRNATMPMCPEGYLEWGNAIARTPQNTISTENVKMRESTKNFYNSRKMRAEQRQTRTL
jgi:hypothetical protein